MVTKADVLADLRSNPLTSGAGCKYVRERDKLPDEVREALLEVEGDPSVPASAMVRVMNQHGAEISITSVKDHRRDCLVCSRNL